VSGAVGRNKPCSNIVDKRDVPVLYNAATLLCDADCMLCDAVLVLGNVFPVLCSSPLSALRRADKASSFSAVSAIDRRLTCENGVTSNGYGVMRDGYCVRRNDHGVLKGR
jgi:hypothetical protein